MKKQSRFLQEIIFQSCLLVNGLLVILLLFGQKIQLAPWLQVMGRMHPLVLHFPIVLLLLAAAWETFTRGTRQEVLRLAGDWFLLSAAFSSTMAVLMGTFLSKEEGYDTDALAIHQWSGIGVAWITLVWYGFRKSARNHFGATIGMGITATLAILLAAHEGATITHGENFVLEPVSPADTKPEVLLEDAVVFTHLVKPVLDSKCAGCHNDRKAKGQLVMTTTEQLLRGGKNGKLWDTTQAGFGLMLHRLHLPVEHKEHMPPKEKPQLTDTELKLIYYWIRGGSGFTTKLVDLTEQDSLRILASGYFNSLEDGVFAFEPADEKIVAAVNNDYRRVERLAAASPALSVRFFGSHQYNSKELAALRPLAGNIVSLNLSGMPVSDSDLVIIAGFPELRRLNLSFTRVTANGLQHLAGLSRLQQLSLSGTQLGANKLVLPAAMKNLSVVYLWNTGLPASKLEALREAYPNILIQGGSGADTLVAKLNKPIIDAEKPLFAGTITVPLKAYVKGAVIRYSTDGKDPDSLLSPVYQQPLVLDSNTLLKARAYLPGWYSSDVSEMHFLRSGIRPDSIELETKPDKLYAGEGSRTLTDLEKGELFFKNGGWLGYKETDLKALIRLKTPTPIKRVSYSLMVDVKSYIMPPLELELWAGNSFQDLRLVKRLRPEQPNKELDAWYPVYDFHLDGRPVSLLRMVIRPVRKLPSWHRGKGERGWIFIDEILLN